MDKHIPDPQLKKQIAELQAQLEQRDALLKERDALIEQLQAQAKELTTQLALRDDRISGLLIAANKDLPGLMMPNGKKMLRAAKGNNPITS